VYAEKIYQALKLDSVPTISVIAPQTDVLREWFQKEGFYLATEIASDLKRCFQEHAAERVNREA